METSENWKRLHFGVQIRALFHKAVQLCRKLKFGSRAVINKKMIHKVHSNR